MSSQKISTMPAPAPSRELTEVAQPSVVRFHLKRTVRNIFSWVSLARLIVLIFLIVLWQLVSIQVGSLWVSTPAAVWERFGLLIGNGSLLANTLVTLQEAVLGLIFGTIIGLVAGILIARSPRMVSSALDPFILGAYSLPRVALAPFFVLWFGIGLTSKIALVVSVVGFVVLLNVRQGIESTDPVMLDALRSMRATRMQIVRHVLIPSVIPWLMAAIKISVGMALVSAVVGELIGSTEGLGWYMTQEMNQFDITGGIVALITMAVLAMIIYAIAGLIERWFTRWQVAGVATTVAM
jgi:NitT/TauT family transport system permease protein